MIPIIIPIRYNDDSDITPPHPALLIGFGVLMIVMVMFFNICFNTFSITVCKVDSYITLTTRDVKHNPTMLEDIQPFIDHGYVLRAELKKNPNKIELYVIMKRCYWGRGRYYKTINHLRAEKFKKEFSES